MSIFLQLFGAGGVLAILLALITFLTFLSNNRKNKQDYYSKVFNDQDKNMASTEKRLENTKAENKELKSEVKRIEKKFNLLLIYFKGLVSSQEDRDVISTEEALEYRTRIQEIEFSE